MSSITGAEIMAAANGYRGWVAARVPSSMVDDVLSEATIRAWRRREHFDPTLGTPSSWISTDVRFATYEAVRNQRSHTTIDAIPEPATTGVPDDPLKILTSRTEAAETLRLVASHVGDHDWRLFLEVAYAEVPAAQVAAAAGLTPRSLRTVLESVLHVGLTVRAAFRALKRGEPPTIETAVSCIPVKSDANRELVMMIALHPEMTRTDLAAACGLSVKSVHNRIHELTRLLRIACDVLVDHDHSITPKGAPTWA